MVLLQVLFLMIPISGRGLLEPPDHNNKAAVARWIIRQNSWGSMATISTLDGMAGEPFSNVVSFNEGLLDESTGIPYFFVTDMDQSMHDIKSHNYTSFSMTEFQTKYCKENNLDPEDPRCGRLVLSGTWSTVDETLEEYPLAKQALFNRHPIMADWESNKSHHFYVARLNIEQVWFIDWFGGGYRMPLDDYYNGSDGDKSPNDAKL